MHVLNIGPTGTGKSNVCSRHLAANASIEELLGRPFLVMDYTMEALIKGMAENQSGNSAGMTYNVNDEWGQFLAQVEKSSSGGYNKDISLWLTWYAGQCFRKETCNGGQTNIKNVRLNSLNFSHPFQIARTLAAEAMDCENEGFGSRSVLSPHRVA